MSLEKIFNTLLIVTKSEKNEFLKLYSIPLRVELNCTIKASWMGRAASASYVASRKANIRFQKFYFP